MRKLQTKFMLNAICIACTTIALQAFPATGFADSVISENFKYFKPIQEIGDSNTNLPSKFRVVEVDPEICNETRTNSPDIRIFDANGKDIPFYKYTDFSIVSGGQNIVSFNIINRSNNQNKFSITLKKEDKDNLSEYRYINFDIPASNYLLNTKLYGSNDGVKFAPIASNGIIYNLPKNSPNAEISSNFKLEFDTVNYSYIKADFEVVSGTVKAEDITNAWFEKYWKFVPITKKLDTKILSKSTETNVTSLIADTNYNNILINKIVFKILDKSFMREIEILSGSDNTKFNIIGHGFIGTSDENFKNRAFSMPLNEVSSKEYLNASFYTETNFNINNEIQLNNTNSGRYLKIRIANKDNPPLNIGDIEIYYTPYYLMFEPSENFKAPYSVFFGSKTYGFPEYDLSYFANNINEKNIVKMTLENKTENPNYKMGDIPFTDRNNFFIFASIGIAVLGMGYLVIRNLRKI